MIFCSQFYFEAKLGLEAKSEAQMRWNVASVKRKLPQSNFGTSRAINALCEGQNLFYKPANSWQKCSSRINYTDTTQTQALAILSVKIKLSLFEKNTHVQCTYKNSFT